MGSCLSTKKQPTVPLPQGGNSRVSAVAAASNPLTKGKILRPHNLKSFCFNDLEEATRSFHTDNLLGQGNFGHVYKGWIDEQSLEAAQPETGTAIAVKVLNQLGCQGLQELVAEIKSLAHLCHPNLVKLIGFCSEDDHRVLVYEFVPRGSLDRHIFSSNASFQPLSWNIRMKIALGAAEALSFLHDMARIIYRDFKSSDVLLDSNYNAKLCDLGLAKDGPTDGGSHVTTRALGSEGYSAPEYMATGHLTMKSDVYSFGVVFLEMLSGKQALDKTRPQGEQRLVEWARPYLTSKRSCRQVLDDNLRNEVEYKFSAVQKAFNLAVKCLSTDPRLRPDMSEVVKHLEPLYDSNEN